MTETDIESKGDILEEGEHKEVTFAKELHRVSRLTIRNLKKFFILHSQHTPTE